MTVPFASKFPSTFRSAALAAVLAAGAAAAHAETTVADAWVRGTVAQQRASGLFARITSTDGGTLLSGSSPVAASVEIHEMTLDGTTMRMRALPNGLPLPAGRTVELQPGGYHVMLMGLKQALNAGDTVPVTFVVVGADGRRQTLQVQAPVRALGAPMPAAAGGEAAHAGHEHGGHGGMK